MLHPVQDVIAANTHAGVMEYANVRLEVKLNILIDQLEDKPAARCRSVTVHFSLCVAPCISPEFISEITRSFVVFPREK